MRAVVLSRRCLGQSLIQASRCRHGCHGIQRRPFSPLHRRSQSVSVRSASSVKEVQPSTAKEAVETGLKIFEEKQYEAALALFERALQLNPSTDEARAAAYNSACCNVKLKRWQAAADRVLDAVNKYNLKLSVALEDDDLAALRDRREWIDVVQGVQGGVSKDLRITLRSEAKAPFRFVRVVIFGGLLAGASLGLFVITTRLIAALQGSAGAPELNETLTNFGINAAAVIVFGALLWNDVQRAGRDKRIVEREEQLALLQIEMSGGRVVPLVRMRGVVRPVVLVGSKAYVNRCMKAANDLKPELRKRGIALVPIVASSDDYDARIAELKAEFAGTRKGKGFAQEAAAAKKDGAVKVGGEEAKWELTPYDEGEWLTWIKRQKADVGLKSGDCYIQIQLDGTVRTSGGGMPPWNRWLSDIPELDSVRTTFGDGIGTNI